MALIEMIRKSLLASLGAAVVTKEKVEEATRRLVEDGKLSKDEAEKLANDLVESGRHQWDEIQEKMTETVRRGLDSFDIGSKREFQDLKERVENLEKRLVIQEKVATEE
jgi:polyhydroxyalkanoate synthesis regulator phasin